MTGTNNVVLELYLWTYTISYFKERFTWNCYISYGPSLSGFSVVSC